ncbi:MAG: aminoacyl-histidine dipeptidase [Clostridiales bacterium]|nr:aminoacyl-histidine dipeptidase [Clostridiales bacterium]
MSALRNLKPKNVFTYFDEICSIPHGSGNTKQISDYCAAFACSHGLRCRQEPCGNVIIWKDASPGCEDAPTVMLQGHMDMVAVRTDDCSMDLEKEGIRPVVTEDGQWICAEGTSLGGDDGIAIACALAILADDTLRHPPLEAVFTVDEEIGLLGASALDASDLRSQILLNMDSEDDGIFLTSCAGGATVTCNLPVSREKKQGILYEWRVSGLRGGHSGTEIHLERANANLLFGRFLAEAGEKAEFSICDVSGGEKDNAIPNQCRAMLLAPATEAAALEGAVSEFRDTVCAEYAAVEPDLEVTLKKMRDISETSDIRDQNDKTLSDDPSELVNIQGQDSSFKANSVTAMVFADEGQHNLTALLEHLPSGIQRWMPEIPGMVRTSLNMGILRMRDDAVSVTFSVRSASHTEKEWLIRRIRDLTELVGGECVVSGGYPAWEYQSDSRIQRVMAETWEEITGEKPVLTGIHAGVECGILSEKLPGIDCISYGPQMEDIHTVREKLNIASVERNYELTVRVLERLTK